MKRIYKICGLVLLIIILWGCNSSKSDINDIKNTIESNYSISIKSIKKITKLTNDSISSLVRNTYEIETYDNDKFISVEYEACDGFNSCYELLDNFAYVKSNKILGAYDNAYMLSNFNQISTYEMLIYLDDKQILNELYNEYYDILNKISDLKFNIY